jgi:hypothetical protein
LLPIFFEVLRASIWRRKLQARSSIQGAFSVSFPLLSPFPSKMLAATLREHSMRDERYFESLIIPD